MNNLYYAGNDMNGDAVILNIDQITDVRRTHAGTGSPHVIVTMSVPDGEQAHRILFQGAEATNLWDHLSRQAAHPQGR